MKIGYSLKNGNVSNHWASKLDRTTDIKENISDHPIDATSPRTFWKMRFRWIMKFEPMLIERAMA